MGRCRREIQLEAPNTPRPWPSSQLSPLKSLHASLNEQIININPFHIKKIDKRQWRIEARASEVKPGLWDTDPELCSHSSGSATLSQSEFFFPSSSFRVPSAVLAHLRPARQLQFWILEAKEGTKEVPRGRNVRQEEEKGISQLAPKTLTLEYKRYLKCQENISEECGQKTQSWMQLQQPGHATPNIWCHRGVQGSSPAHPYPVGSKSGTTGPFFKPRPPLYDADQEFLLLADLWRTLYIFLFLSNRCCHLAHAADTSPTHAPELCKSHLTTC